MPEFFEYLRNITYYLMFATIVGIFAPAGKYRKFVSLVLGFVLLLLMIQPLSGFFQGRDIPVTQWFAGMPQNEETGISAEAYAEWWDAHLQGAFEAQLTAQLERLLDGFAIHSAGFTYSDDFRLTSVRVSISREESPTSERVPFIRIQPPRIRPIRIGETQPEADEFCPDTMSVTNLISEFYNLPKSHIHVNIE